MGNMTLLLMETDGIGTENMSNGMMKIGDKTDKLLPTTGKIYNGFRLNSLVFVFLKNNKMAESKS